MHNDRVNVSEKDKKRCLIRLIESEQDQGVRLQSVFQDRDDLQSREVTFGVFKNCLEKVYPAITREETMALYQDCQVGEKDRASYNLLLDKLVTLRGKRRVLTEILDQIMDQFSSKDNTLFDLFEAADKNRDQVLSKKEFLNVFDEFGIYYDDDQMNDFFYFLDSNNDGNISYRELKVYFEKYVKNKGKDLTDLTRSSFFKGYL